MKNQKHPSLRFFTTLSLLLFLTTNFLIAQALKPSDSASLSQHLQEINKEWQHYGNHLTASANQLTFSADEERIQLHLQLVHQILSSKNTNHLNQTQRAKRSQHLAVLVEYTQKAIFPKNNLHQSRQPYFVDHQENACAVGYLLQEDGQDILVNQIKSEKNYSYIADLVKEYPAIIDWANNNGFTVEELAWIQPGYPPAPTDWHPVGNDGGIEGQINVMKTNYDGSLLYMAGDFTSVDGVSANSIIAWDGNNWQTLGEGVTGEIHALDVTSGVTDRVYIAGNFVLNNNTNHTNIAIWDGTSWTGLQEGDMEGTVFDIKYQGQLYIGGDFQKVNGEHMPYLAKKPFNDTEWNNEVRLYNSNNNTYDTIPNAFSVDAPVHSITRVDGRFLVAGEFTTTAPGVISNSINTLSTNYLAYWGANNWETGFTGVHPPVASVEHLAGRLYMASFDEIPYAVSIFNNGLWDNLHIFGLDPDITSSLVHGFIEYNDFIYAYGNISNQPAIGTYSSGFMHIGGAQNNGQWEGGGANFDKTVRACETFQDRWNK